MRIAVAGGTGLVGATTVALLRDAGHEVVVLSRGEGVDLVASDGLDEALAGVEVVVDATSTASTDPGDTVAFFGGATANLLAAGERAGVRHHVALSIVDMDRDPDNGHYAGKREQERLIREGPLPWTILRAPQFFEFAEMVVGWTRDGDRAEVPALRVRAAAAADVAAVLARVATGEPTGDAEVLGPEVVDLADVARRATAAHSDPVEIVAPPGHGSTAAEPRSPGPDTFVTPTTLDEWLGA